MWTNIQGLLLPEKEGTERGDTMTVTHAHTPQIIQCYICRKNSHQLVIVLISGHGLEQWSAVLLCKSQTVNILGL